MRLLLNEYPKTTTFAKILLCRQSCYAGRAVRRGYLRKAKEEGQNDELRYMD